MFHCCLFIIFSLSLAILVLEISAPRIVLSQPLPPIRMKCFYGSTHNVHVLKMFTRSCSRSILEKNPLPLTPESVSKIPVGVTNQSMMMVVTSGVKHTSLTFGFCLTNAFVQKLSNFSNFLKQDSSYHSPWHHVYQLLSLTVSSHVSQSFPIPRPPQHVLSTDQVLIHDGRIVCLAFCI